MCKVIHENFINKKHISKHDSYVTRSKIVRQHLVYFESAKYRYDKAKGNKVNKYHGCTLFSTAPWQTLYQKRVL